MNSSPKRRNSLVFLYTGYVFSTLSLLFFLGFSFDISAQSSRLSDYLILAGDASCNTPGSCGVNIGPNNEYSGGIIGSYNGITSQGGLIHTGEMYGYGYISLGGGNQVTGDIYGSNEYSNTGNILLAGSGSVFGGNITVNGDIFISSGTVAGEVSHPSGFSYSGPFPGVER